MGNMEIKVLFHSMMKMTSHRIHHGIIIALLAIKRNTVIKLIQTAICGTTCKYRSHPTVLRASLTIKK